MNADDFSPSYKNYIKIIHDIKKTGKYKDFAETLLADEFIIMRHDVEFSLERAFILSQIESKYGFKSSYFIQITNNAYNALSMNNIALLRDMYSRGHHIGLHYHLSGLKDHQRVRDGVRDQIRILSEMIGIRIDRFSIHRPIKEIYYDKISIDGVYNAYAPEYFTFAESIDENTKLDVKYIADSQHRWNYGTPDDTTFRENKKIQLLIHPDFWSIDGKDSLENFRQLIHENNFSFLNTLDSECKHFALVKDIIISKK